ncbi:hypothetical protein [Nocardia sp. NPDC057455]|uniref:hypothetical protein n=1 Tax=Nocardia sp. NPDC057455 TaxID=3346138 RepID=UPI00366C6A49
MSLADDLIEDAQLKNRPAPCKTGVWISSLPERDREAFAAYLAHGGPVSDLWRAAVKNGCPAAETRFRVHCRKRCTCYLEAEIAA